MAVLRLALRNLLGAGLRTWLNVAALSFSFVAIIFLQGIYIGMNDQVEQATREAWYGGGQFWQKAYDPYDPLTLDDAHAPVPKELQFLIDNQEATPVLVRQATIYPRGRFRAVLLKGINPDQKVLSIPSSFLKSGDETIPALVGNRMAESAGLHRGDHITIQWRDVHGTFDARDVLIFDIFTTPVQEIDIGQIWIPLDRLQKLTALPNQATIVVLGKNRLPPQVPAGWTFKNLNFLLRDIHSLVRMKRVGAAIFYFILLFMAMLAIFDTQVLSIFRRRREMGTLMALGMTRANVIALFTLEGAFHGVLAALAAAVWGVPLLGVAARNGWKIPTSQDSFGYAIGDTIFPVYTAALVAGTIFLVLTVTTIVSYLPTRRIAKLKPTDALRGKMP